MTPFTVSSFVRIESHYVKIWKRKPGTDLSEDTFPPNDFEEIKQPFFLEP